MNIGGCDQATRARNGKAKSRDERVYFLAKDYWMIDFMEFGIEINGKN